jgi:hypothetical protein
VSGLRFEANGWTGQWWTSEQVGRGGGKTKNGRQKDRMRNLGCEVGTSFDVCAVQPLDCIVRKAWKAHAASGAALRNR